MKFSEILQRRTEELRRDRADVAAGRTPPGMIPTELRELDRRGGTRRGVLTIYGGATGEGKSVVKLHLARAAARAGCSVTIFDFEDPVERTADRALATETALNSEHLMSANIDDAEMERVDAATRAADWAERIEVRDGLVTAAELLESLRECESDLVLIDYLQGLPDGDSLERTIAHVTWCANAWAQKRNAAVVAFSQVTARVEERGLREKENAARRNPNAPPYVDGFRPFGAGDLAWCSAAGQRCKELWFMHRPGRYARRFGANVKDDVLELSSPKRNWGLEGKIRVGFDPRTARLYDLEKT